MRSDTKYNLNNALSSITKNIFYLLMTGIKMGLSARKPIYGHAKNNPSLRVVCSVTCL